MAVADIVLNSPPILIRNLFAEPTDTSQMRKGFGTYYSID